MNGCSFLRHVRRHERWPFACCAGLAAAALVLLLAGGSPAPGTGALVAGRLYHPDPRHLWNRLHDGLFVRVGPDGRAYGHDRLEPLLWSGSRYLLEPASREGAHRLLQEFITSRGERLIRDPLKRA